MHYRSISAHRGCPDPQLIALAADLGFNDVCFEVEGIQSLMLAELRDRADRSRLFKQIKDLGMTVSIWVHEFEEIDPQWGALAPDNVRLWDELRRRYDHLLTRQFPELDYLYLTVVESSVRCTDPAMLEKLVLTLREACAGAQKKLVLRSFVWTLAEFDGVKQAIERLPDDVVIMTKYVPQDWHRGDIHDPLLGNVGSKTQFVEMDIAGEYFRGDHLAHCFVHELHRRFAYWKACGVSGLQVRVHRGWRPWLHHDNPLHEIQESNLWCLGYWATGKATDMATPLEAWAGERFGPAAAPTMARIALLCDPVVKEALLVCGEPFGDTRSDMPGRNSMLPPGGPPATVFHPAAADNYADPFRTWPALWRWDASRRPTYEKLRTGHPDCYECKSHGYREALVAADEALRLLESIRDAMDWRAFEFVRFRLEENRHHLVLMCEAALAWLVCLRLPHVPECERPALHQIITRHLDVMINEWQAHRHESAVVVWPEGRTRQLQRGGYLDVEGFCREIKRYGVLG